jgi:hypothetical protein
MVLVAELKTTLMMKARNDEWVGARPDVGSTVLLWT